MHLYSFNSLEDRVYLTFISCSLFLLFFDYHDIFGIFLTNSARYDSRSRYCSHIFFVALFSSCIRAREGKKLVLFSLLVWLFRVCICVCVCLCADACALGCTLPIPMQKWSLHCLIFSLLGAPKMRAHRSYEYHSSSEPPCTHTPAPSVQTFASRDHLPENNSVR